MGKPGRIAFLLLFVFVVGCSGSAVPKKIPQNSADLIPQETDPAPSNQLPSNQLPWDKDQEFLAQWSDNGRPPLMASFQATLPDPILFERHNIGLAANYLKGSVVQPGEVFSLNRAIGWRSEQRGFKPGPMYYGGHIAATVGGGVCKIASVLYNVTILANQEVVERHPHSMTVPYVPPGQDATISYGTKDFKFRNTTGAPILIWAQETGGTLHMAFYGRYRPPKIKWIHRTLARKDTWTEYVWDADLPKGTEKTVVEGWAGVTVHSRIEMTFPDGRTTEKDLGVSSYRPCPRTVARGSKST